MNNRSIIFRLNLIIVLLLSNLVLLLYLILPLEVLLIGVGFILFLGPMVALLTLRLRR
ncbi:hypothetical protein Natpe_0703 [Natrinema pellirubrum DSM 15624]|uniref:Uncharacterized protein n=1 Tax=Natrinema pellirubrum (strain DSM 15624 / CIP 106293 / JCM 10476 / NCIMB 786 / 157) TaxID=797303 RepID=L0JJ63_NATP1|nr:hypothetical protein Natpe_0703 [Natrinema pellirubrum DSM 15624]